MSKPVDYFRCPACGSLRTRYFGGLFVDSYCEECDNMFGEFDRLNEQIDELKAVTAEAIRPTMEWFMRRLR